MALFLNTADKKITAHGNVLRGSVPMRVKLGASSRNPPAAWAKYGDKEKTKIQGF